MVWTSRYRELFQSDGPRTLAAAAESVLVSPFLGILLSLRRHEIFSRYPFLEIRAAQFFPNTWTNEPMRESVSRSITRRGSWLQLLLDAN
jgi:hypothetical protein